MSPMAMGAGASCRSPPLALKSLQTRPLSQVLTLKPPKISPSTTFKLQITSSLKNNDLVFEDRSKGVICYRDEGDGEIICEGYDDEEPRVEQQIEKLRCWQSPGSDGELKVDGVFVHQSLQCLEPVNGGNGRGGDFRIRWNQN